MPSKSSETFSPERIDRPCRSVRFARIIVDFQCTWVSLSGALKSQRSLAQPTEGPRAVTRTITLHCTYIPAVRICLILSFSLFSLSVHHCICLFLRHTRLIHIRSSGCYSWLNTHPWLTGYIPIPTGQDHPRPSYPICGDTASFCLDIDRRRRFYVIGVVCHLGVRPQHRNVAEGKKTISCKFTKMCLYYSHNKVNFHDLIHCHRDQLLTGVEDTGL